MKEIIYIQAGSLANYTGTHFWNTQQEYFTYDDETDPLCLHDISFREGVSETGNPTYCPRLLAFDQGPQFGTLSSRNALLEDDIAADLSYGSDSQALWDGEVFEYRQEPIKATVTAPKIRMNSDSDAPGSTGSPTDNGVHAARDVRYWSDFSRVPYAPRSIQRIPEGPDWGNVYGDWNVGREIFQKYDQDTELMEHSVRHFLEECDSPQGLQILGDAPTFGSFICTFITSFRDELAKLPCLVFPLLSAVNPGMLTMNNSRSFKLAVNDALYLRGLNDLASSSVLIRSPHGGGGHVTPNLSIDWHAWPTSPTGMYYASSVLSAHIETSTLPMRLKTSPTSMAGFATSMNPHIVNPFSQLVGIFPMRSHSFDRPLYDFALPSPTVKEFEFARRDVSRGFSSMDYSAYESWCNVAPSPCSYVTRNHVPHFPSSPSFPLSLLRPELGQELSTDIQSPSSSPSVSMFSTIKTTSQTAHLFASYAKTISEAVAHHPDIENLVGVDRDEAKELINDLWTFHDNYSTSSDGLDDNADDDI